MVWYVYVEDNYIIYHLIYEEEKLKDLTETLHKMINLWKVGLKSTGGVIYPVNCFPRQS